MCIAMEQMKSMSKCFLHTIIQKHILLKPKVYDVQAYIAFCSSPNRK